jgi:hypothetical protein
LQFLCFSAEEKEARRVAPSGSIGSTSLRAVGCTGVPSIRGACRGRHRARRVGGGARPRRGRSRRAPSSAVALGGCRWEEVMDPVTGWGDVAVAPGARCGGRR